MVDVRRGVMSFTGRELEKRSATLLDTGAAFLDEQDLTAGMAVPSGSSTGFEKAARHAPAFRLERPADASEALRIRRCVLSVREPKNGDAAERRDAKKMASEDQLR